MTASIVNVEDFKSLHTNQAAFQDCGYIWFISVACSSQDYFTIFEFYPHNLPLPHPDISLPQTSRFFVVTNRV